MASVKEILRSAGGSVAEKLLIPPGLIDVEPGFNVRLPGPELDEHIETLAGLIEQNGFDPTQPISVSRQGDRFVVRSGHCRLAAVRNLLDRGAQIITIPALLEPQGTNDADRAYQIGTQNGQKPLADLEYGALVKRLRGYGQTDEQILTGFGKKRAWLSRILDLAAASPDIHQAVARNEISPSEAVKVVRANGSEAGTIIREATEHARAEGRERARPRDVAAVTRSKKPSVQSRSEKVARIYRNLPDKDVIPLALRIALDDLLEEVEYAARTDVTQETNDVYGSDTRAPAWADA